MHREYLHYLTLIERLHQLYMDILKCELDAMGIKDINNVQALIIHNLSDNILSVGDLTNKRFYSGSNVTYNLKKLVESGYVIQDISPHDRRTSIVRLSDKGDLLRRKLLDVFNRHSAYLNDNFLDAESLQDTNQVMQKIMDYWHHEKNYGQNKSLGFD